MTTAPMQSRLPLPDAARMTAEQRAIHDSIVGTRGNISGPFLAWLHSPAMAAPAEKLGAFCRYGSSLAPAESELLILWVAALRRCGGEQAIHEPLALAAGLPPAAVQAIRAAAPAAVLPLLPTARLQLLSALAHTLVSTDRIDAALYRQALDTFGVTALVEIVGIVGYYSLVAYTLNAFEMRPAAPAAAEADAEPTTTTGDMP